MFPVTFLLSPSIKTFSFQILILSFLFSCTKALEDKNFADAIHVTEAAGGTADVFIIAGESNIGIANITGKRKRLDSEGNPVEKNFPEDVIQEGSPYKYALKDVYTWNWHLQTFQILQAGVNSNMYRPDNPIYGSEISFMPEMKTYLNKPVYLIKYGRGGSTLGLKTGDVMDWNTSSKGEYTDEFILRIKEVKEYFKKRGVQPNFRGIIFWIGINDGNHANFANDFKVNLQNVATKMRAETNLPQLPFIVSKVNDEVATPNVKMIRNRMSKFILEDKYAELFSTDNYPTNMFPLNGNEADGPHFTGAKYLQIGKQVLAPIFKRTDGYAHSDLRAVGYINQLDHPSGMVLDEPAGKMYLAQKASNGSIITEIDLTTNIRIRDVATVPSGAITLDLAENPKRLFLANEEEGVIRVINLGNEEMTVINAKGVNNVCVDNSRNRFYVSCNNSLVKVFDLSSRRFIRNLPQVFSKSNDIKVFKDNLYVCSTGDNKVYKIDAATYSTSKIITCVKAPSYLAVNTEGIVVTSGNDLFEINETTDEVTGIKRSFDNPREPTFPTLGKLYVCNRNVNYIVILKK